MATTSLAQAAQTTRALTPAIHTTRGYWSPEPQWLHTLGQIAGTLLLLELMVALVLVLAIASGLAFVAYWTHKHVVPLVGEYSARAKQVVDVGARAGDRVVEGVAEFHGRRMGFETALRVFFLGPQAAAGLVRRAPTPAPLPSEAPDAIARPVTTDTTQTTQTTRIRFPQPAPTTAPTTEPRADRRPPRISPAPTMAAQEAPPIAPATPDQATHSTHGPAPIAPANAMQRAAPLAGSPLPLRPIASTLPIGRAGAPQGMRAGAANGIGAMGFLGF